MFRALFKILVLFGFFYSYFLALYLPPYPRRLRYERTLGLYGGDVNWTDIAMERGFQSP
jgi:hypothetical protein